MKISYNDKYGYYEIFFYYKNNNGERKQKHKRGFKNQKEAKEYYLHFMNDMSQSPEMTFKKLFSLYMNSIIPRSKPQTILSKETMYKKNFKYFDDIKIKDITPLTIRNWQNTMIEQKYKPTTLKARSNALSFIFNFAVKFYGLKENPCRKAGSIGCVKSDNTKFWTLEEYQRAIKYAKNIHIKLALDTLFWTGMRIGELKALKVKDFDLINKTVTINATFTKINGKISLNEPKTKGSKRTIKLPEILYNEIKSYLARMVVVSPDFILFHSERGTYQNNLNFCGISAGIGKLRLHGLRHSHASLLINNGVNITAISKRLGHENIKTTLNVYSHMFKESENKLIDTINTLSKNKT